MDQLANSAIPCSSMDYSQINSKGANIVIQTMVSSGLLVFSQRSSDYFLLYDDHYAIPIGSTSRGIIRK